MASNRKLLVLPGDGIGPEVMGEVRRVMAWFDDKRAVSFDVTEDLVGGVCYDTHGVAIRDETMSTAMDVDAVLFGAVGGPKWEGVPWDVRPEAGLLRLRKDLDLFANLRPAIVLDALIDASTLKPDVIRGLDLMILRELTAGVYFGEPKGMQTLSDGTERCVDTQAYTVDEVERVCRVAFELARLRRNRVHCAEKSNVMETGVFWRQISRRVHEEEYPDVEFHHILADNCAMQLIRNPRQFDVIVTDNLFGDILSDEAAMMTGSLGMLPSASLGPVDPATGKRHALYEPVHGTAPDIAGQGKANPMAMLLSFAMMLRYSFDLPDDAAMVEQAAQNVLAAGFRTADIMSPGAMQVSTGEMGTRLIDELNRLNG
jgi:3-isopropylmalate dehydrogenase